MYQDKTMTFTSITPQSGGVLNLCVLSQPEFVGNMRVVQLLLGNDDVQGVTAGTAVKYKIRRGQIVPWRDE